MSKFKLAVGNFDQICRYVESNSVDQMLKYAFQMFLQKNNISIPVNNLPKRRAYYEDWVNKAYVGKFISQFVGGARLPDSIAEIKENLSQYIKFYNMLEDDLSKKTLYCIMYHHLFLDLAKLNQVYCSLRQYYIPELLPKREHQVFVDCGACWGETVVSYIETYGDYDKIYAYEPAPENYRKMVEELKEYKNVILWNRGVSDQMGEMKFTTHMPESANRLNPLGDQSVMISTVDKDIPEKITFLKMDIESAEPNALLGAQRHIQEDHPELAICVYHTITDIRTIPEIIYSMNPNQKFYLRHHGKNSVEETVLYASPND